MIRLVSPENLPTSQKIGTYKMMLSCPNCLKQSEQNITKGILVAEWNYCCSSCGCTIQQFADHHLKVTRESLSLNNKDRI